MKQLTCGRGKTWREFFSSKCVIRIYNFLRFGIFVSNNHCQRRWPFNIRSSWFALSLSIYKINCLLVLTWTAGKWSPSPQFTFLEIATDFPWIKHSFVAYRWRYFLITWSIFFCIIWVAEPLKLTKGWEKSYCIDGSDKMHKNSFSQRIYNGWFG